jgi:hypothetical protein
VFFRMFLVFSGFWSMFSGCFLVFQDFGRDLDKILTRFGQNLFEHPENLMFLIITFFATTSKIKV